MVRKRGTHVFMNPGGKPVAGETALECALREVKEELGLVLEPAHTRPLGQFVASAANESGHDVRADVFDYAQPVPGDVAPAAEIEEVLWVDPASPCAHPLAPLFTDHIQTLCSPAIRQEG